MKLINYLLEDNKGTWDCNALTEITISKWLQIQKQWHKDKNIDCKIIIKNVVKLSGFEDENLLREHFSDSSIRIK